MTKASAGAWGSVAALGVGCVFAVLGLWVGERIVRVVAPGHPHFEETESRSYMERDDGLGWRPGASLQTRVQARLGERIVYDVTYTFDQYRRRVVPGNPDAGDRRFLLFFGCSQTFGEGLQDDETLPYYVSASLPGTHVYNYAFRGYGPQHMLARLESSNLRDEVAEAAGAAIFVFPASVVDRLIGGSGTMSWLAPLPYYRMENDEPVRDGFFQTTRPSYSFFARSLGSSRLMQTLGIAWPPRIRPRDLAFACAVFAKAQRLLSEQLGPTPLIVMLHPHGGFLDLGSCLGPLGIPVLDYHAIFAGSEAELTIPIDGHTNARGNRRLADQLVADLGRILPAVAAR